MPCDFTVIMHQTAHVGDDEEMFGDVPFKGPVFRPFTFSCPDVVREERSVLFFQTRDVDHARNVIGINGSRLFGGLPVSSTGDAESPIWNGNVALVEAHRLLESGNELNLQARDSTSSTGGNVDDFLINNVVILFKTNPALPHPGA